MLKRFATTLVLLLAGVTFAYAQATDTAERIATYDDWSVYVANSATGRVCFAVSQPQNTEPTGVNRGGIYFMLSTWPSRGVHNEASIIIGYPFADQSTVTVTVDEDESFEFFTINDGAWLSNLDQENDLVVAIQRGLSMVVRGRSQRGTDTTDTYSLHGATAALNRVGQECPG
jgi:hypothetical protein